MNETNRDWHDKHCRGIETPDFVVWFTRIYGYDCSKSDEDEYWLQRIFALKGWLACEQKFSIYSYDAALLDAKAAIEELRQR